MEALIIHSIAAVALKDLTDDLFNVCRFSLSSWSHPGYRALLEELDLEAQLRVVSSLSSILKERQIDEESALGKSLRNVSLSLNEIKALLEIINLKSEANSTQWFLDSTIPSAFEKLKKHKATLDTRLDLMIKISQVSSGKRLKNEENVKKKEAEERSFKEELSNFVLL
eukprot:TRINITY_DN922_c0_g1_i1.p1 TRINITY_DN922_c0_g1~~TRINITY_DN922_c0_g1_i1.p1  ORF type:complete len:169 (-),score=41.15 TRINITY_DN922_c0_g1_i1:176-682(-)